MSAADQQGPRLKQVLLAIHENRAQSKPGQVCDPPFCRLLEAKGRRCHSRGRGAKGDKPQKGSHQVRSRSSAEAAQRQEPRRQLKAACSCGLVRPGTTGFQDAMQTNKGKKECVKGGRMQKEKQLTDSAAGSSLKPWRC